MEQANFSELKENMCKFAAEFCDHFIDKTSVEILWIHLRDKLLFLLDKFVPSKLKNNKNHQPWINRNIKQLRPQKQASYNCAKFTKSPADWSYYKKLKKNMQRQCHRAFRKYLFKTLHDPYENGKRKDCLDM